MMFYATEKLFINVWTFWVLKNNNFLTIDFHVKLMSLKDGIVFWTIISYYETKARVSFYRCLWNTFEGNVGFKEYFTYVRTLLTYFNNRGSFRISSCYLFYYRIEFDSLTNNNRDWGNRKAFKAIGVQLDGEFCYNMTTRYGCYCCKALHLRCLRGPGYDLQV